MKLFLYSILFLTISGCCFLTKCSDNYTTLHLRLLDYTTGKDLVFGPSKLYSTDSIKIYSINMYGDTVRYIFDPVPIYGMDSALYVSIDVMDNVPVFLRLNASDTDTLTLVYWLNDGGHCCPTTKSLYSGTYNHDAMDPHDGRLYKKKN